eukprot:12887930-Alexandrium_andersonii.AAC.1
MGAGGAHAILANDLLVNREGGGDGPPNPGEGALDVSDALAPLPQPSLAEAREVGAERRLRALAEHAPCA